MRAFCNISFVAESSHVLERLQGQLAHLKRVFDFFLVRLLKVMSVLKQARTLDTLKEAINQEIANMTPEMSSDSLTVLVQDWKSASSRRDVILRMSYS